MPVLSRIGSAFRGYDWMLTLVAFVLTAIGLAAIYSVDLSRGETLAFFPTQSIALAIGLVLSLVAGSLHKTRYEASARIVYIGGLLLLIAVLFFGQTVRGTTGWFRVGPFSFQPAEFAKVALVLLLGWWVSKQGRRFDRWDFVVSSGLATGLLVGLILLQPDFGSAFILLVIWLMLLLLVGVKRRHIIVLICVAVAATVVSWFFLFEPYQKDRVFTFLHPERDPLGTGYNVTQSIVAIGAGRLFGRGLGFGSQSQLHFLPEAQTDFIFAVIGEELGFVGAAVLLLLYILLLWRLIRIARACQDEFSAYTVLGIALLLCTQVVINIGGTIGLLPVTGVPLPFVSYGGSSLIITWLLIGIAQSMLHATRRYH